MRRLPRLLYVLNRQRNEVKHIVQRNATSARDGPGPAANRLYTRGESWEERGEGHFARDCSKEETTGRMRYNRVLLVLAVSATRK
jgi:hypothetical protein